MTKHTPGPWKVYQVGFGYNITPDVSSETPWVLAKVYQCSNAHANAQLMTAAPDLLEALKAISEGMGRYNRNKLQHAENTIEDMKAIALAAIDKAEGREP